MTTKKHSSFMALNVVLLVVFIGMVNIIFEFHRYMLAGHIILIALLLVGSIFGMLAVFSGTRIGSVLMSWVFAVFLIDIIAIRNLSIQSGMILLVVLAALVGFLISVVSVPKKKVSKPDEPIETKVIDMPEKKTEKKAPVKKKAAKKKTAKKKKAKKKTT